MLCRILPIRFAPARVIAAALILFSLALPGMMIASAIGADPGTKVKPAANSSIVVEQHSAGQPAIDIERMIAQLGAADFHRREEATQQLLSAGPKSIPAIAKAAQTDDVETAYRAVRILQAISEQDDSADQRRALAALESLAATDKKSTADLATDALAFYHLSLQDRAIDQLKKLGADMRQARDNPYLPPRNVDSVATEVVIDSRWSGSAADFELLKLFPNLQWLRVVNVSLNDEALQTIGQLPRLMQLDLYGTGASLKDKQNLEVQLPGITIDYRKGAKLGISGYAGNPGCQIGDVVPGTAASDAGLQSGDEVLKVDGQPIENFEEMTGLISSKKGGEQIQMEIRRYDKTLVKDVTLGSWK